MDKNSKIYIAGHTGLVGSAIVRCLELKGYSNILTCTHSRLDLTRQADVEKFFLKEKPTYVVLAAAYVGGISANAKSPADFFFINSMIQNNVIHAAYKNRVKKLLFLGSSCIYPKLCIQPISENLLLSGYLEETNEAYAIAKISGLKMCQFYNKQYGTNFISCMPTNLYGPNDNFDLNTSHVLPAIIRKVYDAKNKQLPYVELWGTGTPKREFLYVDDMADACVFLMENYDGDGHINIGTGQEISINELALIIKEVLHYSGEIRYDNTKPDGTPRKLLDVRMLTELGWEYKTELTDGVEKTIEWYINSVKRGEAR